MVLLNISSTEEKIILKISTILLKEKWAIDINLKRNANRLIYENNQIIERSIFILTAKTKSLLFSKIESRLKEEFKTNFPELYAQPIISMEGSQAENVIELTQKI